MNNSTKLTDLKNELKQILDDYNFSLKHNTNATIEDIETTLKELSEIKGLLLQQMSELEAKLRRLSVLME